MRHDSGTADPNGPDPRKILVFAGGNALGAYQAGAFETLSRAGWRPGWVAGTSIGAINAAIVAGNAPGAAVDKLREFWRAAAHPQDLGLAPPGGELRRWFNVFSAVQTFAVGRHNLFRPRWWTELAPLGAGPRSLFERRPLVDTLSRLIDFERLNSGMVRLTINAVDMELGEEVFFDTRRDRIEIPHLLASSALVPDFEPVEIDGRKLGDGSLVRNTPLAGVLGEPPEDGSTCIVVDLFSRTAKIGPESLLERRSDILFASQTASVIRAHAEEQRLRGVIRTLADRIAPKARQDAVVQQLAAEGRVPRLQLIHLAYAPRYAEPATKTYDYSRATLESRWAAGREEMAEALHGLDEAAPAAGFAVHEFPRRREAA